MTGGADRLRLLRMRAQRLLGRRPRDVGAVVRGVGGLQAQDTPASRLAVRVRSAGLDEAAVRRACNRDRSVVRTWVMRGTLHLVAAEDVGWLVGLLGPRFAAGNRRRRLQLGLDDRLCERALEVLPAVLAGGPLSRAELVRGLAAKGVRIDPGGQAPAHLVGLAALRGLICRGPDLDGDEASYVLLEDWVGPAGGRRGVLGGDGALAELARRYLGGHGPAAPEDLAAWSGLALGRARQAFELAAGDLREVELDGRRLWAPAGTTTTRPPASGPVVRLLGRFDDYLLGWRDRDLTLDPAFAGRIQAGGGWIHPAVVVDGRVVGTWRARRAGGGLDVTVEPFGDGLPRGSGPGLEEEAADIGRFLGAEVRLAALGGR
ncbi:MAG TPA: winged helix DNA-binding domain-containing protein [Actinomycetota bacterium]|nr:winged helix DNA-binding domain-containing protein [Actinomycetota bacterium]